MDDRKNPKPNQYKEEYSTPLSFHEPLALPDEEKMAFEEEQPFDQVWLWTLMGIELFVIMIPLLLVGITWWAIFLVASVMMVTMSLLASIKLYTRIDNSGIHYRFLPFHRKERTIWWDDIDAAYMRKYNPVLEYGGWGMRTWSRNGAAYNVKGNHGIQIVKKNGKKILIGTQRPEEAAEHLKVKPLTV